VSLYIYTFFIFIILLSQKIIHLLTYINTYVCFIFFFFLFLNLFFFFFFFFFLFFIFYFYFFYVYKKVFNGTVTADNIKKYKYVALNKKGKVVAEESFTRKYSTTKINEVYNR